MQASFSIYNIKQTIKVLWQNSRATFLNEAAGSARQRGEQLLREQIEPLLLGDGLLSEQLENDGPHQIPFVLKLKGPLVLD